MRRRAGTKNFALKGCGLVMLRDCWFWALIFSAAPRRTVRDGSFANRTELGSLLLGGNPPLIVDGLTFGPKKTLGLEDVAVTSKSSASSTERHTYKCDGSVYRLSLEAEKNE
jgi:hypothetical protein